MQSFWKLKFKCPSLPAGWKSHHRRQTGVTEGQVITLGATSVKIAEQVTFHVVTDDFPISWDGILGADFLRDADEIKFVEQVIEPSGGTTTFLFEQRESFTMVSTWEDFYAKHPPPQDLAQNEQALKEFTKKHLEAGNKVVLVTSGGTTVPLEHNTVRFVDNFSAGTRGSVSAEYFLEYGYAVIFMYRVKSLEPFSRHFIGQKFLDLLQISDNEDSVITVVPEYTQKVATVLRKYKEAFNQKKLLQLTFTTFSEYLWLLRSACQALAPLENKAILYLAAAVSDFYIPSNEMSMHKISSSGPPTISLQLVPKILAPLVSLWVPKAFVVSFKLETDESLLISKARTALNKYHHNLVIANMLQTRKQQVIIVSKETNYVLSLTNEQLDNGEEIEQLIVRDLVEKHLPK